MSRIMRNGQQVDLSDLRAGDIFTAVIVTDEPPKVVSEREVEAMATRRPSPLRPRQRLPPLPPPLHPPLNPLRPRICPRRRARFRSWAWRVRYRSRPRSA